MSMPAVRLFVGSALTISFGLACRDYTFDGSAFNVLLKKFKVQAYRVCLSFGLRFILGFRFRFNF